MYKYKSFSLRSALFFYSCLIGIIISCNFTAAASSVASFPYDLVINRISYSGTYEGETSGSLPNGIGQFITDENSPSSFSYSGNFKNGTFSGEGSLVFEDGSCLEGKFKGGNPSGTLTLTKPDKSYSKITYTSGIPYGVSPTYTAEDEYNYSDFYYNGESIRSLIAVSSTISYRDLYSLSDTLYGDPIRIEGRIENIYDTTSTRTLKISDDDGNIYWGRYSDTSYNKYQQAILPVLKKDEQITLYGFYCGVTTYSCPNDITSSNYSFPEIAFFYAEATEKCTLNRSEPDFSYELVSRFPYAYYKLRNTMKGTIENIVYNDGSNSYLKFISDNGNTYYFSFKEKDLSFTPIPGDKVTISGTYNGLYKEYNSISQRVNDIYPLLSLKSIRYRK